MQVADGIEDHTCHFTPTSGSWLNFAEVFFSIITRQATRRGSFTSVADLIAAIEAFIDGWNDRCHPFTWTKTANEILPRCRPSKRTSFTRHWWFDECLSLCFHGDAGQWRMPNRVRVLMVPDADRAELDRRARSKGARSGWCSGPGSCCWPRTG